MGLSIIKKTVGTYGEKIELGQGTQFILLWPQEIVMLLETVGEAIVRSLQTRAEQLECLVLQR